MAMPATSVFGTQTFRKHVIAHDLDEGLGLGKGDGHVTGFYEEAVDFVESSPGDGVVDNAGGRGGEMIWRRHLCVEDLT